MTIGAEGLGLGGSASWVGDLDATDPLLNASEDAEIAASLRQLIQELEAGRIDPESVLMSCRSRLNDLDAQINHVTAALDGASTRAAAISADISELRMLERRLAPFVSGAEYRGAPDLGVLTPEALRAELSSIGLSEGRIGEILGNAANAGLFDGRHFELGLVTALVTGTAITNPAQLNSRLESLTSDLREANSGNERLMISLQSLLQQRTSVIQMSTNMLKAIDEGVDAVVGNLR